MTFPGHFKEQILPERLASISLSFLVDSMSRQRGGIAPNIAYTMALLGEKPRVMEPAHALQMGDPGGLTGRDRLALALTWLRALQHVVFHGCSSILGSGGGHAWSRRVLALRRLRW